MVTRAAVGRMAGVEKTPQEVQALIVKAMQNESVAKLAASPATPKVFAALERAIAGPGVTETMKPSPKRDRPSIFSMRPQGL